MPRAEDQGRGQAPRAGRPAARAGRGRLPGLGAWAPDVAGRRVVVVVVGVVVLAGLRQGQARAASAPIAAAPGGGELSRFSAHDRSDLTDTPPRSGDGASISIHCITTVRCIIDPMTPFSPGQDPGTPGPAQGPAPAGLIWTRPPKEKRERPTREAIVAAATDLADTHGLDAVSVRRVAAVLKTRPMDLYRDFARKDELIDLMVDEGVAGAVLDEIPRDWRDALTAIARALRPVCLAPPRVVAAAGGQPLIGPNVMRHVEQSLEATAA